MKQVFALLVACMLYGIFWQLLSDLFYGILMLIRYSNKLLPSEINVVDVLSYYASGNGFIRKVPLHLVPISLGLLDAAISTALSEKRWISLSLVSVCAGVLSWMNARPNISHYPATEHLLFMPLSGAIAAAVCYLTLSLIIRKTLVVESGK
jgi:hypothetical protein